MARAPAKKPSWTTTDGSRPWKPQKYEWDSEAELDFIRNECRRNFWFYFLYGFGAEANPKGQRWIDYTVHRPLARWYEGHVRDWMRSRRQGKREQKHLAVIVHREVGKTTLITQAGQSWLHLLDPEISTFTGGEKTELAMQSLESIKAVLDGSDPYSLFTTLYGNWSEGARKWAGKAVTHGARRNTTRRDPSFGTFAVETSIVGAHPDAIFYDDPISYERMLSDTSWLESVNSQVTSLYPVIQGDGLIVWVGTRYDDGDHFGTSLRSIEAGGEGVASLNGMPSEELKVEPEGKWHVYFMAGRDMDGKPTTPKVWPESRLKDYQRRDPLRYAAQVMNDPAVSEFNPLTREQISQCVIPSKEVPWAALRLYLCCDTAFWDGKSRARKDDTVVVVQGLTSNGSGDVYIIEAHGSPTWRGEDFKKRLVTITQRLRTQGRRVAGIVDEDPHGGKRGSWAADLRNAFHDANEPMPPFYELPRGPGSNLNAGISTSGKVRRMVGAAQFWVDGHVRIVENCPGFAQLTDQMAKIGQYMVNPRMKNDWADAHAMIFEQQFYHSMRRPDGAKPFDFNSRSIPLDGLSLVDFRDRENDNPRPPIK